MAIVQKITLVDRGQDFTEWYVRDGIVIDCQPLQGRLWVGTRLEYPEGPLAQGSTIHMRTRVSDDLTTLNYPVESIQELGADESAELESIGRVWAERCGFAASDLGL